MYPQLIHDAQLGTDVYQQTGTIVTREIPTDLELLFDLAQERRDKRRSRWGQSQH
ncbi:hypothetical protein L3X07_11315 [Levilactobacillus brevis]|nr:hypothetical protein [Levilactobacillus brevis]